jgi:hypothetical protein
MNVMQRTWYPAIFVRESRRTYLARRIEDEKLARLELVCRKFRPFLETRVELVRESASEVLKGLIGHYGRVSGAPAYLAVIADMGSPRAQECAGYVGEALILEATSLGLGTCWVGGMFRPGAVAAQVRLEDGEKILAVIPVGYSTEAYSVKDKLFRGFVKSAKRKPLHQLVLAGSPHVPWIEKSLEAARLAPSAANRQPWRFLIEDRGILICQDSARDRSAVSRRLDCGIAMLHAELGAMASGIEGRWEFLDNPEVARYIVEAGPLRET